MPRYISAHIIACMPHQRLRRLLEELQAESGASRLVRAWCDTIQGRMVCEWEAPNGETLRQWLQERKMNPQWVFRVEFFAESGRFESPG